MPANYVLLEKITVGAAGTTSISFTSIPQTGYTDLVVYASIRSNVNGEYEPMVLGFNNNTNSAYTNVAVGGNGSSAVSTSVGASGYISYNNYLSHNGNNATAGTFSNMSIYIPNYTSNNFKSVSIDAVTESNSSNVTMGLGAGLWSNTAPITSIQMLIYNGTSFMQNSTFYLYGVAKLGTIPAISPYATGGNTIMTDGTFWYHAFRESGIFTPGRGLTCDVLTVAGGGGGGATRGGGGGAGGAFATNTFVSIAQGVTVGLGGLGGAVNGGGGFNGTNGANSQFGSLTAAIGGGFGVGNDGPYTSGSGGSSGGGVLWGGTAGTAVSGQGFIGGINTVGYLVGGGAGGGGGAGAVGANTANNNGGNGGAGLNTWSSWLNTTGTGVSGFIAGGGGGATASNSGTPGTGGSGGGGAGGLIAVGAAGVANTGGGGGGGGRHDASGTPYAGANGGSGLVIVRYSI